MAPFWCAGNTSARPIQKPIRGTSPAMAVPRSCPGAPLLDFRSTKVDVNCEHREGLASQCTSTMRSPSPVGPETTLRMAPAGTVTALRLPLPIPNANVARSSRNRLPVNNETPFGSNGVTNSTLPLSSAARL